MTSRLHSDIQPGPGAGGSGDGADCKHTRRTVCNIGCSRAAGAVPPAK